MKKNFEMDMTSGPILKKLIIFALPLVATNVLQLLFNAADIVVLGRFVGDDPVAAVSSTTALINLIVNLFVGLSVGANVMVAKYLGKGDDEKVKRFVGMSVVISVIVGIILVGIGVGFARTFLIWMACDADVLDMAVKYLSIYFMGMPIIMLYNFCASILRASGDSMRPLIFLVIGGMLNIGLNIFFVTVVHLDVEGVAIATVASNAVSAVLGVIVLCKSRTAVKLQMKYMRIYKEELIELAKVGVPAGLQGCLFAFSNVLIQSSINSFGKVVMSGNGYASQIEGVVYNAMNGVALAALSFVSQNGGAGKIDRIKRTILEAALTVTFLGLVLGISASLLTNGILHFITDDQNVINYALLRVELLCGFDFLCGLMDVFASSLRGLGKSTTAMLVTLFGSCVFRVVWIKTVFVWYRSLEIIYWSYPISWALTSLVHLSIIIPTVKKLKIRQELAASEI